MRAVILAGGRGTRLQPYTSVLPKPLVPVGDLPILEIIIHQLTAAGFSPITLTLGYLGELIRAFVANRKSLASRGDITFVQSQHRLPLRRRSSWRSVGRPDSLRALGWGLQVPFAQSLHDQWCAAGSPRQQP